MAKKDVVNPKPKPAPKPVPKPAPPVPAVAKVHIHQPEPAHPVEVSFPAHVAPILQMHKDRRISIHVGEK